jgi:acyl-coenzyme A thioesterase PaaI-like protein
MSPATPRRQAVERLAASVRALADAAVETDIEPSRIDAIAEQIDALRDELRAATDTSPYSGLVNDPPDHGVPEGYMPLNPVIGPCSPVRPDVKLVFADQKVVGTAVISKRFVGPPGFAHGGISAMLLDQLVSVAPLARGMRTVTKELRVVYRRALPLGVPLDLVGWCPDEDENGLTARCEIRAEGRLAVEGTAMLATYESLAKRHGRGAAGDGSS